MSNGGTSEPKKPYVGENGRLYFNYAVGAEYEFKSVAGKRFRLKIIDCEFADGKEYYFLESSGKELPTRFTADKLEKQLSAMPYEVVDEGERRELPLLLEEVKSYYTERAKERNFDNAEENNKLKGTEYYKLLTARASLNKRLMLAEADGCEADISRVKKQLEETKAKISKILKDKKINIKVLIKERDCKLCNDTGIIDGKICECAVQRAEQIKAFNAALRLANND